MSPRELLRAVVPGALLVLAASAVLAFPEHRGPLAAFLTAYPYLLVGATVLLAAAFRRDRAALGAVTLAMAGRLLADQAAPLEAGEPVGRYTFSAIALLVPLLLGTLAFVPERNLFRASGLARLAALCGLAGVAWLAWQANWSPLLGAVEARLVDLDMAGRSAVPQPGLIMFILALGALLIALLRHPGPVEGGLLWALVATYRALADGGVGEVAVIFLASGGLILLVAVVQASAASAYRDALTGIPSRRALDEALTTLHGRYTLALADVDHFKQFNDTHGHDVGDQVLRMVAGRLAEVGGGGRVFRYGGEEFAVLFPGKSLDACLPNLEAVRKAIAAADFTLRSPERPTRRPKATPVGRKDAPRLSLTVSIGVAERGPSRLKVEQVMRAADAALFRAKGSGRNRVAS